MSEPKNNLMIPYGVSDFKVMRNEGLYYIDKTEYLAKLEARDRFVFFVRPRRFGKSLFTSMLQCYYDRREAANFEKLFGGLWLGAHPTPNRNRYMVLMLDFSEVNKGSSTSSLEDRFASYMSGKLRMMLEAYPDCFDADFVAEFKQAEVGLKFNLVMSRAKLRGIPTYLVIDEYDNFTNSLLRATGNEPYKTLTHGTGFYREWFKSFKGSFDRIFMTGVSPVTMDDLTSGFNIAANISQDAAFNAMLGFSETETLQLYRDFKGTGEFQEGDPERIVAGIKPWYDGYCFAKAKVGKESVFNSDMVLYHLKHLVAKGRPPENMVDVNIATDYDKLETIVDLQRQMGEPNVEDVLAQLRNDHRIHQNIRSSFDCEKMTENVVSLLYYHGLITNSGRTCGLDFYCIPNAIAAFEWIRLVYGIRGLDHDYVFDLEYSEPTAPESDLAAKADDGIEKLRRYASDRFVPELARGTRLHLILFQFKGTDLVRLEEIPL